MISRHSFIFISILALLASTAFAAEVKNVLTGQENKRAFVQYDLIGKLGEKEADVAVTIEIGNDKYPANKLSLSGDFGKNVKIGIGRKVYWDLLKDMPAGFEGEIGWEIEASHSESYLAAIKAQNENLSVSAAQKKLKESSVKQQSVVNGQNASRFIVSDLTIKDKSSGLIWMRNLRKPIESVGSVHSFVDKMNNSKYAGYDNWRLPTISELKKMVSYAKEMGFGDKEGHYVSDYMNSIGFNSVYPEYALSSSGSGGAGFHQITVMRLWSGYTDNITIVYHNSKEVFSPLLVRDDAI